jgi:hypothetical protein
MKKLELLLLLSTLSVMGTTAQEEDSASVTYSPTLGVYLLQYGAEGQTYVDTLEPATKIDPVVSCDVTFDNLTNLYTYSYILSLLPSSQQYLVSFQLFYSADIQGRQKPSSRWDIFDIPGQKNTEWSNTNIHSSGLHSDTTDIRPGGSMSGFSYKSDGLPIIINGYFEGNVPGLAFSAEPPTRMHELLSPILAFPNNTVIRRTLGPKDPPTPFIALDFLDTLISMAQEALSLGWIEETYGEKIMNDLNDAREKIEESPEDAKEILEALIPYIIDDGCDWVPPDPSQYHLTSEGCALLRYNVEYLIEQIE